MSTDDFFRARLDGMADPRHSLVVLGSRLPWAQIEAAIAPLLAHKNHAGRLVEGADLFGPTAQLVGTLRAHDTMAQIGATAYGLGHGAHRWSGFPLSAGALQAGGSLEPMAWTAACGASG